MTKLNKEMRERIRTIYSEESTTMRELALEYGVTSYTINQIIHESPIEVLPTDDKRIDIIKLMLKYGFYSRYEIKNRYGITLETIDNILQDIDTPIQYILTPQHLQIIREKYKSGWSIPMIADDIKFHPLLVEEIVTYESKFLTPFVNEVPLRWSGQSHIARLYLSGKYSTKEIAFIMATTSYHVGQVIAHRGQSDKDRARINREAYLRQTSDKNN